MKLLSRWFLIPALVLVLAACSGGRTEIIISGAASLSDALKEAQLAFEAENPSVRLRFNFGSSGALAQQIEQGAPADLFISAATAPMEALVKKNLVASGAVMTLATNKLVLIRGQGAPDVVKSWEDLRSDPVRKIAIGNPQHVPAGQYARAVLEHLNLWAGVSGRFVLGEDVRQVLNYVESGEVEAGIVYSSDAALSRKVIILAEAPAGSHAPVVYPMAVLKESKHSAAAGTFADYLLSPKGRQILAKYGFGAGN